MRLMKWVVLASLLAIPASAQTPFGSSVVSGLRKPAGYEQLVVGATAASLQHIPPMLNGRNVGLAVIVVENNNVRWRDDGTNPTATVGMPIFSGSEFDYTGLPASLAFISQTGSATINVAYYY